MKKKYITEDRFSDDKNILKISKLKNLQFKINTCLLRSKSTNDTHLDNPLSQTDWALKHPLNKSYYVFFFV